MFGRNNVIYSSYTSEKDATHVNKTTDFVIYNNEVHTYRFDWYRGERVDYYIDDVLQATITENVPTLPMKVWIGAWCPSWAGTERNETSQMKVLSFSYEKFI